jgi:hypothetical protein
MSGLTRRSVLAAVGAAALAGCNTAGGSGSGDAEGGVDPSPSGGGSRLASLRVANNDDTAHRVALQVERNDEVVHWTDHDLDARTAGESSVFTVEPDWPDGRAAFVVEVQVDGERHRQFAVGPGDCRNVFVEIDGEGRLNKYANSDNCGGGTNETA